MNPIPDHYQSQVVTMYAEKRSKDNELPSMPKTTARAIVTSFLDEVPQIGELTAAEIKDRSTARAFRTIQEHVSDQVVLDSAMAMIALSVSRQVSLQRDWTELAAETEGSSLTDRMSWISGTWLDAANSLLSEE